MFAHLSDPTKPIGLGGEATATDVTKPSPAPTPWQLCTDRGWQTEAERDASATAVEPVASAAVYLNKWQ